MFNILLIIYFLLFIIISIKNLKWAVYLVIFTLPAYLIRFEFAGLPATLLEGEISLVFLVWLIKNIKLLKIKKSLITDYLPDQQAGWLLITSVLLFLIATTISMFISPNLQAAAGLWKAYFIEPVLFLIVFVSIIKPKDIKRVLMFLCSSVLILSLFAIYQKFTGVFISNPFWAAEATRRVTGFYSYPNALALYLAPIVTMLIGWVAMKYKSNLSNLSQRYQVLVSTNFILFSTLAGLLAIYFTKSKGALLAVFVGIIFYALFYKGFRKYFIGILSIFFIALLFYSFIAPTFNVVEMLKGESTVEGGDSISTRTEMWSETWQMLKTKPILGAGLAGYQTAVAPFHSKDYIEIYLYPHNIILNFWTEIGLLGLIAFLGIIIWFYRTGIVYKDNRISIILMAGMTALLVHGLVDVPYFKNDLAILFWIIIGLIIILWRSGRVVEGAAFEKL